jgi:ubiquinone/menaquinone biosynthesis C-methylase UbiE/cytosine/adenosine deaminase-related metal-dependent hydrolase
MRAMSPPVPAASGTLRNRDAFAAWSVSYDANPNPLLMLEERYLLAMLPAVRGRDVLDAGCGSGRWLRHLAARSPGTLRGIDTSSAMLRAAAQKLISGVELIECSCDATPFADHSIDLILASFVLSYFDKPERLAGEFTRIARGGCDLVLSDMHPETEAHLGWKRSFATTGGEIRLDTTRHHLEHLATTFRRFGWEIVSFIEPEFGTPERQAFAAAGRVNRFTEAAGHPAIYLAHFRRSNQDSVEAHSHLTTVIQGARCTVGAQESTPAQLLLTGSQITRMISPRRSGLIPPSSYHIDLDGYRILPGLINAHDHLEFGLFPRLASSRYANASAWAEDIHGTYSDVIATHRSIPKDVRLWWGGLRNLLCGVTTVCHHNPLHPVLLGPDFPVRVVRDYTWAHSLAYDPALRAGYTAAHNESPFLIHACEGVDVDAKGELSELDSLGMLRANTAIMHGLAVDDEGAALMESRGVSLVICPSSNHLLFGRVPRPEIFQRISKVAVGSDSSLTAEGDLLDEVRFAIRACSLQPTHAWRMVTELPAAILRLQSGEGFLKPSATADIIAIRDFRGEAQDRLPTLSAADIELVMTGGRVMLASPAMMQRLPAAATAALQPLWVEDTLRWLRAPVAWLLQQAESVLGKDNVRLGGKRVRLAAAEGIQHGL